MNQGNETFGFSVMNDPQDAPVPYSQFICIGTGISGIGLGATLQRWYGITDVQFFEREADVGGTWFLNNYPGAGSDIPNILYSLSYEPNLAWSKFHPGRDEILEYLKTIAHKYNIPPRTSFRSQVIRCQWVVDFKRWRVHVKNLTTDQVTQHDCQFLFTATGVLDQPRQPDVPGLDQFEGPIFHTARWRHDVNLQDKRVVVFGNGCSGTQLVPALAPKVRQLTHIVRSKHWIVPSWKEETVSPLKILYKIPGGTKLLRLWIFYYAEDEYKGVMMTGHGAKWRARKTASLRKMVRKKAPEEHHELLTPDFEYGCKRRVYNFGYVESLHQNNVTLTNESPQECKSDHIVMKSGKTIKADAIIFANGFHATRPLQGVEVIGKSKTLEQHWRSLGGVGAYNTCALSGFPNFFMLGGPNSFTSHTSVIMAAENATNLALRQIKPVLEGRASAVEVTRAAELEHVSQLQAASSTKVWMSGCNGWYATMDEEGRPAWNAIVWPYSQAYLWYRCLFPTKSHWKYSDMRPAGTNYRNILLFGLITAALLWLATGKHIPLYGPGSSYGRWRDQFV